MSDMSQGPGWWQASDDRWYAPERHPDYVSPPSTVVAVAPPSVAAPSVTTSSGTTNPGPIYDGARLESDHGSQVLTIDRPIDPEPVWRPGSKRPTSVSSDFDGAHGPVSEPGGRAPTVSSQVSALRVFIFLGVGFFTLGLVVYLGLRHHVGSSSDLIYRYSGSRTRLEAVTESITQATTILDLVIPLVLLLSRSFKTVKVLLVVALLPNIVALVTAAVGRHVFGVVWAAAIALYVGYVIKRVGQAESMGRSSYRGRRQKGYSTFEVMLAGYIVLMTAAYGVLTFDAYRATPVDTPLNQAAIIYQNGSRSQGPASDPAPTTYVEQTAYAHDFKVLLNFDPNSWASVTYQPSRTVGTLVIPANDAVNISGDDLSSTDQVMITVVDMGSQPPGVTNPATCPINDLLFKTTIMGEAAAVCGFNGANPLALASFNTGGHWFKLEFASILRSGVQPPLSISTLEAITTSLKVG